MGKRRLTKATGPHDQLTTSRIVIYRQLRTDRLHIFYSEAGMGPPVILIHGLGASSRWWFPLYPQLSSDNFRALAPDLPGFGRSPGPPLPLHRAGRSVIEFADRIGLGRFFLCGHSMGGIVAAHIAAEYGPRVRRLVLIDSAGIPANHTPRVPPPHSGREVGENDAPTSPVPPLPPNNSTRRCDSGQPHPICARS